MANETTASILNLVGISVRSIVALKGSTRVNVFYPGPLGFYEMSRFGIGDRVEIIGEIAAQFQSKIGVVTGTSAGGSPENVAVQLLDGPEVVVSDSNLNFPKTIFADKIFDSRVSPARYGLRGSSSSRHLRFISRDVDIHLRLSARRQRNDLLGQLSDNGAAPRSCMVTLLFDGKSHATTTTDDLGEFEVRDLPTSNGMIEILLPSHRILLAMDVSAPRAS